MDNWISVKDRLPECEKEVLIVTDNGIITTAMYEDGKMSTDDSAWNWWEYRYYNSDDVYNNCVDDKVTHWMPLPEPPKEAI